jgi:hypothetical protein
MVPIGISWRQTFNSLFVRISLTLVPLTGRFVEFRDVALRYSLLNHSSAHSDPSTIQMIGGVDHKTFGRMRVTASYGGVPTTALRPCSWL